MVSAIAPVGQIDFLNVHSGEVGVDVGGAVWAFQESTRAEK